MCESFTVTYSYSHCYWLLVLVLVFPSTIDLFILGIRFRPLAVGNCNSTNGILTFNYNKKNNKSLTISTLLRPHPLNMASWSMTDLHFFSFLIISS